MLLPQIKYCLENLQYELFTILLELLKGKLPLSIEYIPKELSYSSSDSLYFEERFMYGDRHEKGCIDFEVYSYKYSLDRFHCVLEYFYGDYDYNIYIPFRAVPSNEFADVMDEVIHIILPLMSKGDIKCILNHYKIVKK